MARTVSRSPSYRRRYSPSSPVGHRHSRRSRRDRSRSPYSRSRRRSRSTSPRRHKSRSPTPRRRTIRSPTPRRHKKRRSTSSSVSPINNKSSSPSVGAIDRKNAIEKLKIEEEEKKRRQREAELKLLEEETAKRVEEAIRKQVEERLNSEEVKLEIQRRIVEGRNKLLDEVAAQLEKEKEAALIEARQKEEQARIEREELDKMLEENRRRVEEAQKREALEQQRKEEERYRELEQLQRQKEEAMRRKKLEEEEERSNQMKLLGSGEFYMDIAIGTPPNSYRAIMDTGSDLIWTQCQPCINCFRQPTLIFDPTKSSSFSAVSCSSKLCDALSSPTCDNGCEYMYSYADGSRTEGTLGTETFTFNKVSVPKVGFGCSNDNNDVGGGFSQGAGLVGLGGGPLSLVSQIGSGKFSYCLTSMGDIKPSSLLFGSLAKTKHGGTTKTTPLIRSPSQPTYYYLSLEGITVGSTRLSIPESRFALNEDGSGGVMIDSGTTLTYLEDSSYNLVKQAFIAQTRLPVANPGNTGLDLCFTVPSENYDIQVPTFIFHFKGADLELPVENIMISDSSMSQLVCLAMAPGGDMSIFGNIQQQNILVLYDIRKHKISFTPRNCDRL
ncbi:hypothetical protein IFM89_009799 [Coptis chinensis]|uniref:Peptidase A1 domain-containing protein n=1 Tax=Coptis chinensis TaxID=261450 RepID=A0A835I1S2_9MAGN|nr:hypothetical protein IFM89_009799 [Coptis chinensis]